MGDRDAFEAHELRNGRPESALFRAPAGDYEDEDVARAWRVWQSLHAALDKQLRRPRGIGPQHKDDTTGAP